MTRAVSVSPLHVGLLALFTAGCLRPSVDGPGDGDTAGAVAADVGAIEGVVRDADGQPVAGAHVIALPGGFEATAGDDGAFALRLLPAGSYTLTGAAPDTTAATTAEVTVAAGDTATQDVDLAPAAAGAVVTVTVRGPDGALLPGAVVTASTGAEGTTDDQGTVVLEDVVGDTVDLSVAADGLWGRSLEGAAVSEAGGLQWETQLSGRNPDDATEVGSQLCSFCHTDTAAVHAGSAHARALTDGAGTVPDGAVDLGGGASATLAGGTVTLVDADGSSLAFDVAGWIGDTGRSAVPWTDAGDQGYPLPLVWIAGSADRPGYPDTQARLAPYETERWLDATGRFSLSSGLPDPAASAEARCLPCHATGFTLSPRGDGGLDMVGGTAGSGRYRETGVGCERCHGPGSAHASSTDPGLITQPALLDPERAQDACGLCHSRTTSLDGAWPFPVDASGQFARPGGELAAVSVSDADAWPSGAAAASRMQTDELALSPHGPTGSPLACGDCHDVHGTQPLAAVQDNSLCLSCHLDYSFAGDIAGASGHQAHGMYTPDGVLEAGRCVSCHMPPTAAGESWSDLSGAGDRASHLFDFVPPSETIAVFDALGEAALPPGEFPVHGCVDCHTWGDWLFRGGSTPFPGPHGDPTLRESHVEYQTAVEAKWP